MTQPPPAWPFKSASRPSHRHSLGRARERPRSALRTRSLRELVTSSQRPGGLYDKTGNFLHPVADGDGPHLGCNRLITKRPRARANSAPAPLQTQWDSKSAGETTPGGSRFNPPTPPPLPSSAAAASLRPQGGGKLVCLQCRPTTHLNTRLLWRSAASERVAPSLSTPPHPRPLRDISAKMFAH